jgi:hypothetical protein
MHELVETNRFHTQCNDLFNGNSVYNGNFCFTAGLLTTAAGSIPSDSVVFLVQFLLQVRSNKTENQTEAKKIFQGVFHFRCL